MPRYTITIDAEYGSSFQEDKAIQILETQLLAWKAHMISSHKGNKADFTLKKER